MEFDINSKINTFNHNENNEEIFDILKLDKTRPVKYIYVIDGKISIESTLTDKEIDIIKQLIEK